jgi:CheY-like chemotaxis protein
MKTRRRGAAPQQQQEALQEQEEFETRKKRRVASSGAESDQATTNEDKVSNHDIVLMAGMPGSGHESKHDVSKPEHAAAMVDMDIPELGQLHVLVIDSDRSSRQKSVELLQQCGYKVLMSSRSSVAFEMLEREFERGLTIDVILKAHEPPASSAVSFLEKLRSSRKEYKDILVIVYSDRKGQQDKNAMATCFSLGVVDWWVKPLRINEVQNIWTRVWQQKHIVDFSSKTMEKPTGNEGMTAVVQELKDLVDAQQHYHHKHHHKHHHHHHYAGKEDYSKTVSLAEEPALTNEGMITSGTNGSSGKQSGTVPTKKSGVAARRRDQSTADVAEVADVLTSMRTTRGSTESSGEEQRFKSAKVQSSKIPQRSVQKDFNGNKVPLGGGVPISTTGGKTEDGGSGGSTQFMMRVPFIPPVNYGQYPYPWISAPDMNGSVDAKSQAIDFQRAWLQWQRQYQHAMQMNYAAMQGGKPMPFGAESWSGMPMQAYPPGAYAGWGPGSGIPLPTKSGTKSASLVPDSVPATSMSGPELTRLYAVKKYKEKRNRRTANASNKIRYKSRKLLADARPRVKGQFVQVRKQAESDEGSNKKTKNESEDERNIPNTVVVDEPRMECEHGDTALAEWKSSHDAKEDLANLASGSDNNSQDKRAPPQSQSGALNTTLDRRSDSGSNSPQ